MATSPIGGPPCLQGPRSLGPDFSRHLRTCQGIAARLLDHYVRKRWSSSEHTLPVVEERAKRAPRNHEPQPQLVEQRAKRAIRRDQVPYVEVQPQPPVVE